MSLLVCVQCSKTGPENPHGAWRGFKIGRIICKRCYYKEYAKHNAEAVRQYKANWIKTDIERYKLTQVNWRRKNNKRMLAKTRRYQASKLNACPKWLTELQLKQIERIYIQCPQGYHVDHIVPLQGKNVCGLHVPWNLQYLLASENHSKGNKYA